MGNFILRHFGYAEYKLLLWTYSELARQFFPLHIFVKRLFVISPATIGRISISASLHFFYVFISRFYFTYQREGKN